jgi:hypothetical protein
MLRKLRPRSIYDVMAAVACFVALAGGTAYAANEWTGANIVDGSLTGADVKNGTLTTSDIRNSSLENSDFLTGSVDSRAVTDGSLTSNDIGSFSLTSLDFSDGSVNGRIVADNSLTGTDINESTLNMPPTTTATFAGIAPKRLDTSFVKVASKILPGGSWAIVATANMAHDNFVGCSNCVRTAACELRGTDGGFIGGATDRRAIPGGDHVERSLSMEGGAQVPAGGGEVSLWCNSQSDFVEYVTYGQMMMIRLDGFS